MWGDALAHLYMCRYIYVHIYCYAPFQQTTSIPAGVDQNHTFNMDEDWKTAASAIHVDHAAPAATHPSNEQNEIQDKKCQLDEDALQSARVEHGLSVRDAIAAYPAAIFWSFAVSGCVIMEGYDQILVQSLFAYPTFQKQYGSPTGAVYTNGQPKYEVSAAWQAGLANAAGAGAFFGVLLNGYVNNCVLEFQTNLSVIDV